MKCIRSVRCSDTIGEPLASPNTGREGEIERRERGPSEGEGRGKGGGRGRGGDRGRPQRVAAEKQRETASRQAHRAHPPILSHSQATSLRAADAGRPAGPGAEEPLGEAELQTMKELVAVRLWLVDRFDQAKRSNRKLVKTQTGLTGSLRGHGCGP